MGTEEQPKDWLDHILNGTGAAADPQRANDQAYAQARSSASYQNVRFTTTPGEGTPELAEVMRRLQAAPPLEAAKGDLALLAVLTGDDPDALNEQYERFLAQREIDVARGNYVPLNEPVHPDFLASTEQLAYGRVVGDSIDMNPALAALLNPTGGLVGPGNASVQVSRDDPAGIHSVMHDASGYLGQNVADGVGPGYAYLSEPGLISEIYPPMDGQIEGLAFWSKNHSNTSAAPAGAGPAISPVQRLGLEDRLSAIQSAVSRLRGNLP